MSLWPREIPVTQRVVGLDRTYLAWMGPDAREAPTIVRWSGGGGAGPALRERFGVGRPGRVHVIVGADAAIHWVQTPPASIRSFAELRQVVAAHCIRLYGGMPADWRIAGDWSSTRPFVCCAIPRDLADEVERQLTGVRLVPKWHSAWSLLSCAGRSFPSDGWSAVRTPERITVWHCTAGRVDALIAWPATALEGVGSVAAVAQQRVKVEALRSGIEHNGHLHLLDLTASGPLPPGLAPVKDSRIALAPLTASSESAAALALSALVN